MNRDNQNQKGSANSGNQQRHQHNATGQQRQKGSLSGLTQRIRSRRSYQKNNAGERASKILAGFTDLLNGNSNTENFKVFLLDASIYNLARSAVLLTAQFEQTVLVHTMIVAGSGGPLPNKRIPIANGKYLEIPSVDSDVDIGEQFWTSTVKCVQREFVGRNINDISDAGYCVIHEALDITDIDALDDVLSQACCAIDKIHALMIGDDDLIITGDDLITGETITAGLDYNPGIVTGISGNLIRTDLQITMMGQASGQQNLYTQSSPLSTVGGFVNLVYSPPEAVYQNPHLPPNPAANHFYTAQLILTNVTPLDDTLEAYLLALSTAMLADDRQAWVHCFAPRHDYKGLNPRDIGAVGLEVNLRGIDQSTGKQYPLGRVDVKDSTDEYGHAKILTICCRPNLVFSLDVEEYGHQSWLENTFVGAARRDIAQNAAIIRAADNLTNGHFSAIFNQRMPNQNDRFVVGREINRVHLGNYRNENGDLRDIRDIDYLAMLNLNAEHHMETVEAFSQTDEPAIDENVRLDQRTKLLTNAISSNVTFTGFAQRITFHPAFMDALSQGLHACGLTVLPEGVQVVNAPSTHGNSWVSQYAVSGNGGLFSTHQAQPNTHNAYAYGNRMNNYY